MSKRKQLETLLAVTLPETIATLDGDRIEADTLAALEMVEATPSLDPSGGWLRDCLERMRDSARALDGWRDEETQALILEDLYTGAGDAFDILLEG